MRWMPGLAVAVLLAALAAPLVAADSEEAMARDYSRVRAPAAPRTQEWMSRCKERWLCKLPHGKRGANDAHLASRRARLHGLPRR